MYKKMNVVLIVFNCVINLNAMENQSSSIADVSRDLDSSYKNSFYDLKIEKNVHILELQYQHLVKTKKSEQTINFPEEQKGYSVNTLSLNNQSIKTILFDLPSYIHSYIQPNHIQHIDISHNDLEDLPLTHMTEMMPHLETLNASHNKIEYVSLRRSAGAKSNKKLEKLNISNNALRNFNVGEFLCIYRTMMNIDLSGNPIESIKWSKEVCSPIEYPTINLKNITLSNDAKKKITKNYIKCLQASSLYEIKEDSFKYGAFAGLSWLGTPFMWVLWEKPAMVFGPTIVLGVMGYYLAKLYYSDTKQEKLNDIEKTASQRLLFDNDKNTAMEMVKK